MVPDPLHRHLPAFNGVAASTVRSHLAAVHIGVAVGAIDPGVGENRLDVALRARKVLVHATQRKIGFAVIKFRHCANRFPP